VEGDEPVSGWGRWTAEQIALRYPFSLSILCALCSLLFSCGCCWRLFLCSWCSLGGVAWAASVWRFPFSVVHDCFVCIYIYWEVMNLRIREGKRGCQHWGYDFGERHVLSSMYRNQVLGINEGCLGSYLSFVCFFVARYEKKNKEDERE
jgi:hypothetical protein